MLRSCRTSVRQCDLNSRIWQPFVTRRSHASTKALPTPGAATESPEPTVTTKSKKASVAKPALLTLTYPNLNLYTQVAPPTNSQLSTASRFFVKNKPHYLFTAAHFREFPSDSSVPEVTFLGRSNVGKSSLLNALFNRVQSNTAMAHVSSRPGKTKTMNVFGLGQEGTEDGERAGGGTSKILRSGMSAELLAKAGSRERRQEDQSGKGPTAASVSTKDAYRRENWLGRGGVAVVDCPGYGYASREEWGQEVIKYLQNRKQLRRAFILIDAEHGLKATDRDILSILRDSSVPHQIILSKADKILGLGPRIPGPGAISSRLLKLRRICEDVRKEVQPNKGRGPVALGDILCCSAERNWEGKKLGLDGLRWAILQASGLSEGLGKKSTADLLDFTQGEGPRMSV